MDHFLRPVINLKAVHIVSAIVSLSNSDLVKRSDHGSGVEHSSYDDYFDYDGASGSTAAEQYVFPVRSDGRLASTSQPSAPEQSVGPTFYASPSSREWHSDDDYDLHEYLYARSKLESQDTGEILPHEWQAMLDNHELFALIIRSQYYKRALKPLRAIRLAYIAARRQSNTITEAEAELDYCKQVCGNDLEQGTFRDSTNAYVLEARAMFQRVKTIPWGKESGRV